MTTDVPPADALPDALVATAQWCCWREQSRDGKPTKVPIEPETNAYASATDPATWRAFETAREHASATECGLGFVFTADGPFVGVDLDDCRDPAAGTIDAAAADIIARLDSYTEVSPSGTGVHVLVKGELPDGRNRHDWVELYDEARFFTVTGEHVPETPTTVERRQDALDAVHAEYVAPATNASERRPELTDRDPAADISDTDPSRKGNDLDDAELLRKAKTAANGAKFARLYRGSTAGYPSQSEADMALCCLLAFWTGGDATQMDRLFRDSGLMRPKWDEQHYADGATYGERTIERAISATDEFYGGGDEDAWESVDTPAADDAEPPDSTADATSEHLRESLVRLRAELNELEAENERLRAELAAERERRGEGESTQSDDDGFLSGLFG